MARMLGLDSKSLTVPDYEITARLERLLSLVQPPMAIPVVPVTTMTNPSHDQTTSSYNHHHHHVHHTHSAHERHRSPSPVSRRPDGNHRARSLSPLQMGLDPKTY